MRPHSTPSSALGLGTPDSQALETCNLMINHLQKGFLQQSVLITGQFFVQKQVKSGSSLLEPLLDKTPFSIKKDNGPKAQAGINIFLPCV